MAIARTRKMNICETWLSLIKGGTNQESSTLFPPTTKKIESARHVLAVCLNGADSY